MTAILLGPRATSANGPEIGWDGGSIVPLRSHSIRLIGEKVWVNLTGEGYPGGRVDVDYWLENLQDKSSTIEMSFFVPGVGEFGGPDQTHRYQFSAKLRGESLPVEWRPADPKKWQDFGSAPDSLPVWRLSFASRDTLLLHVSYRVQWSGGADGANFGDYFSYLARPARLWAGTLDFAEFRIAGSRALERRALRNEGIGECDSVLIQPPGWFWDGNAIAWRFEDWEPDQDISISFSCIEPAEVATFLCEGPGVPNDGVFLVDDLGSRGVPDRKELLELIRKGFDRQPSDARRPNTYVPFSVAWLTVHRAAILARHGRRFVEPELASYFRRLPWYHPDPHGAESPLTGSESAVREALTELQREIIAQPTLLLPPTIRPGE
jgi:hypothetical protein